MIGSCSKFGRLNLCIPLNYKDSQYLFWKILSSSVDILSVQETGSILKIGFAPIFIVLMLYGSVYFLSRLYSWIETCGKKSNFCICNTHKNIKSFLLKSRAFSQLSLLQCHYLNLLLIFRYILIVWKKFLYL